MIVADFRVGSTTASRGAATRLKNRHAGRDNASACREGWTHVAAAEQRVLVDNPARLYGFG
jgi:hypothetical protein